MDARDVQDAAGLIKRQADEIDRLRARVAELEAIEQRAQIVRNEAIPDSVELTDVQIARYILGEA